MSKNVKKILILCLALLSAFSFLMFSACSNKGFEIKLKTPTVTYTVGENVNVSDFIELEDGVTYEFKYAYLDSTTGEYGEEKEIVHKTFYAGLAGDYKLNIDAKKNGKKASAAVDFTVKEADAYVVTKSVAINVDWKSIKNVRGIMSEATPFVLSDTPMEQFISKVKIIPSDGSESFSLELMKGSNDFGVSIDSWYVGNEGGLTTKGMFTFNVEGDYEFELVFKNAGTPIVKTLYVRCTENLSNVNELSNNITIDSSNVISWSAVDGAEQYKVKIAGKNFILDKSVLSYNVSSYITHKYIDYEFVVLPTDANGNYLGKIIYRPSIVAQGYVENSDGSITLGGLFPEHHTTGELTNHSINHYAFRGDYGIGTFVDIEFKGNNMPYVMFFADEINGNITHKSGGKGILFASGMITNSGIANEDYTYQVFGPNRMNAEWSWGGALARGQYLDGTNDNFNLLTQRGRNEAATNPDTASRTYRWIAGTRLNQNDQIVFVQYLYDANTGELLTATENLLIYSFDQALSATTGQPVRTLTSNDVEAGSVVIYAAMNGLSKNTTFKITTAPGEMPEQLIQNGTESQDGTITLKHSQPSDYGVHINGGLTSKLDNSYYALKGDYGVGYFTEIVFKGNNLPNVMLFADSINGNVSYNGGNGLFILNDISRPSSQSLRVFGPNRMNANTDHQSPWLMNDALTQNGFIAASSAEATKNRTYRYVVGTKLNAQDEIVLVIKLYDYDTNELLAAHEDTVIQQYDFSRRTEDDRVDTSPVDKILKADDFDGTNIIIFAAYKENKDDTVFKVCQPYFGEKKYYDIETGVTHNADGSMTIAGTALGGAVYAGELEGVKFNYTSIDGKDYGVGKYYTFEFTGNNMPIVTLFADNLNGQIYSDGGAGVTLINGSHLNGVDERAGAGDGMDYLRIWATNQRINAQPYMWLDSASGLLAMKNFPSQSEFDANKDYIYIIGTSESQSGKLVVSVYLYEKQATQNLYIFGESIETNLAVSELTGTKTMITPALKDVMVGEVRTAQDTTIKSIVVSDGLVEPENVLYASGATFNYDGSVTLDGVFYQNRRKDCYTETPNSYVAKEGEYGVGTEISITYAPGRANMPNLVLFADKINGNMTSDGGKGIFITPGVKTPQSGLVGEFRIYGPDRMNQPNTLHYVGFEENASGSIINYFLLGQCVNNDQGTTTTYTWKIKTSLDTDNTLVLTMYLYKDSTGGLLAETEIDTGLVWGTQISAGSMIAYAAIYNEGTAEDGSDAVLHDSTFTWTVTEPE